MKSKLYRSVVFCLVSVVISSLFAGCRAPTKEAAPSPIEITDQLGRTVKLERTPQRIVSLAPSNTEILFALGLGDKVVGVTEYCDYPPEAQEKPKIGGFSTPNIEKVVALSPDLVLAAQRHEDLIIPQLEQMGLAVFALKLKTLDETLEAITLVGEITGKEKEASQLVEEMGKRIKAVTDKTDKLSEAERPRVFHLTWHDPLKTSGSGTLYNELIQKAGGMNIFSDVIDIQAVDFEALVARDPQVMIAGVGMGSGEDKPFQYLKTESRLKNTEAAKNGRIYGIDLDLSGRAGPRIVDGLELFARCIHPEIFGLPDNMEGVKIYVPE